MTDRTAQKLSAEHKGRPTRRVAPSRSRSAPKRSQRRVPERAEKSIRLGDLASAARLISRIEIPAKLSIGQKRQLLAQLCRLIGEQIRVGQSGFTQLPSSADVTLQAALEALLPADIRLSPRMRQTLARLLKGDSEKQIATHLGVSRHTVHVYVKAIYRKFGIASRGELLARFVKF